MSLGLTIAVVALCIVVEGFHSGSEIAVYSADRIRLRSLAERGSRRAKEAMRFTENTERLLGTTLVGTNLGAVTAAIVITNAVFAAVGDHSEAYELYAILIASPLTLIFAEILPKSLFQRHANRVVLWIAYPLAASSKIFYPIGWLTTRTVRLVMRLLRVSSGEREPLVTREDLRLIVRRPRGQGAVSDIQRDEQRMVRRILEFRENRVENAMKPLVDIHAFAEEKTVAEALAAATGDVYSRYPIFRERITRIVGMVTVLDLVNAPNRTVSVAEIMRPIKYVPESARIEEVFAQMQKSGQHMAVAVDEYGGASGIITVEDVFEEIVGEIEDETDKSESPYRQVGDNDYVVRARTEIDRINELLDLEIPRGEYETLGGFLMHRLGRIPPPGTRLTHGRLTFIVTRATERSVEEVYLSVDRTEKSK